MLAHTHTHTHTHTQLYIYVSFTRTHNYITVSAISLFGIGNMLCERIYNGVGVRELSWDCICLCERDSTGGREKS